MTETPYAQRPRRPRAVERMQESATHDDAADSVAGALEGLAEGVISLVQSRLEMARHEATSTASTFGGLVVIGAVGLAAFGFGLAARLVDSVRFAASEISF